MIIVIYCIYNSSVFTLLCVHAQHNVIPKLSFVNGGKKQLMKDVHVNEFFKIPDNVKPQRAKKKTSDRCPEEIFF